LIQTRYVVSDIFYQHEIGDSWLCTDRLTSRTQFFDSYRVAILQAAVVPMTAAEIRSAVAAKGWRDADPETIAGYISELTTSAWLYSPESVPGADQTNPDSHSYPVIQKIYIPHRGDWDGLDQRITVWRQYLARQGRDIPITVVQKGQVKPDITQAAEVLGDRYFLDLEEQIGREGDESLSRAYTFLCQPGGRNNSYGVNRNRILLLGSGLNHLVIDDDSYPNFAVPKDPGKPYWATAGDSTKFWPLLDDLPLDSDGIERHDYRLSEHIDFLSIHEETLAIVPDPSHIWNRPPEASPLADSHGPARSETILLRRMEPGLQIGISVGGYLGFSGIPNRRFLLSTRLNQPGDSFESDLKSALEGGRHSPYVVRLANAPVYHSPQFMGLNYAQRHDAKLPPFSPMGRDEDGLFGIMTSLLSDRSRISSAPVALGHLPFSDRLADEGDMTSFPDHANILIRVILAEAPIFAEKFEERIGQCGRFLCELSRLSPARFTRWFMPFYLRFLIAGLRGAHYIQDRISDDEPNFKAANRHYIETMQKHISDIRAPEPVEFPDLSAFLSYLYDFGEAMESWPALCDLVKHIRGSHSAGT
jgi:hypothetical protein